MEIQNTRLSALSLNWVLVFVLASSLLTSVLGYHSYQSNTELEYIHNLHKSIQTHQGKILLYDEILTSSAFLAASTGSKKWIERYTVFEEKLSKEISELLAKEAHRSIISTSSANDALVALEKKSLALSSSGASTAAIQILLSPTYEEEKRRYSEGMIQLLAEVEKNASAVWAHHKLVTARLNWGLFAFLMISVFGWTYLIIALASLNKRLRSFNTKILTIQENERSRIAREIHDDLGQQLSAIKIWLSKSNTKEALGILEMTQETVRMLAQTLHPSLLSNMGLVAALKWNLKQTAQTGAFKWELIEAADEALQETSAETNTQLYRISQEAIHNVQKHAAAKHVKVSIEESAATLRIKIVDDGVGLKGQQQGLGFLSMNERAQMIGASIKIQSPLDKETKRSLALASESVGTMIEVELRRH